jgi:translation initiation factor IF-1
MVKNTNGGKGSKSLARKLTSGSASSHFPVPSNELETFALVTKMHGPSCDVLLPDGSKLLCHIRNKFRGRSKRQNVIVMNNVILVGFREWESTRKNCDLMYVYDSGEISKINDAAIGYFQTVVGGYGLSGGDGGGGGDLVFTEDLDEDVREQVVPGGTMVAAADIDFDDI